VKIGDFKLKDGWFLAPLAGVTDRSFRRLCSEAGAALVYTEMVSAKALLFGNRNTWDLLRTGEGEGPAACQLFGAEPETMAEAVLRIEGAEMGHALYDVNMGCPVPKVVKNGEGSALLRDPARAASIISAMKKATKKPVTAKIRAGWDAASVNAAEVARRLEAAGADAICLHARTREQFYAGCADWPLIAQVKAAISIPVIGNGDVRSAEDARRMVSETGCDFVMIGRGALGNPWIFRGGSGEKNECSEDVPISLNERRDMFVRQARLTAADKGEKIAVLEMRGAAGWYFKGLPGAAAFRGALNQLTALDALIRAAEAFGAGGDSRS